MFDDDVNGLCCFTDKTTKDWFCLVHLFSGFGCYYIKYNTGLGEKKEKYNKNDKFNKKVIDKDITYMLNYSRTRYNK